MVYSQLNIGLLKRRMVAYFFFSITIIVYLHQFHKYVLGKMKLLKGFLFGHCEMLRVGLDFWRRSDSRACEQIRMKN